MGVAGSTAKVCNLTQQELDGFVGTSHFSAAEVKALWVQFASLGKADGGSEILLNRADFQTAVGMKNSTFVDRLFAVFDENDDGAINFSEFLTILSVLSTKALPAEKLEVSFKIYDMDKDGKIGRDELATMLRATMDEHDLVLDDAQIESVIDATFSEVPESGGPALDMKQYSKLAMSHPMMLTHLTLNVSALVTEQTAAGEIPLAS